MSDKITIIQDSTSLDRWLCPRFWQYSEQERLEPLVTLSSGEVGLIPVSDAIMMGTYGHKLMEIYYKAKARGNKQSSCLEEALSFNPFSPETAFDFKLEKPRVEQIKQRFREYCYTFSKNDFVPINEEAVEVGFSYSLYESNKVHYILEGRIDLLGTINNQPVTVDFKFQEVKRNLYKKSIQFRNYALVTNNILFCVQYVRMAKTPDADTFKRDIVGFSSIELEVWEQRLICIYDDIADSIKYNSFPQKFQHCSGKYNQPCKYTPLCEEWNTALIEAKKKGSYTKKEAYKPW